jgi:NADP-dependent 3-hydroxy acid dehydrogenase YdfG
LADVEKDIKAINPDIQVVRAEADITDAAAVDQVYAKVKDSFGSADVLINNAGVLSSQATLADAVAKDWWQDWVSDLQATETRSY